MVKQNTLDFLAGLAQNNHKEWFDANRKAYELAKKDVTAVVEALLKGIAAFEPEMANVEAKHALFRIFKDVRFSKDKTPYKVNMGAWMAKGGKKSPFAGYYLHIEPGGKSFLAGGSYMPPSNILKAIREAIDYDHEGLQDILNAKSFKQYFGELSGDKVKTTPKGYDKEHPAIELLKHKSLVVMHTLKDKDLLSKDFVEKALEAFRAMQPLNDYLNRAIAEADPA